MKLQLTTLDAGLLRLTGDLDIYNVETAREAFLNHLSDKRALELELSEVESCDAAGVQLLLAAGRGAASVGKLFSIRHTAPCIKACAEVLGVAPGMLEGAP